MRNKPIRNIAVSTGFIFRRNLHNRQQAIFLQHKGTDYQYTPSRFSTGETRQKVLILSCNGVLFPPKATVICKRNRLLVHCTLFQYIEYISYQYK